jgi:hypothetical protein
MLTTHYRLPKRPILLRNFRVDLHTLFSKLDRFIAMNILTIRKRTSLRRRRVNLPRFLFDSVQLLVQ